MEGCNKLGNIRQLYCGGIDNQDGEPSPARWATSPGGRGKGRCCSTRQTIVDSFILDNRGLKDEMKNYEKCFVYQCLAHTCHGAGLNSEKFIKICLDCPCFRNWIEMREKNKS